MKKVVFAVEDDEDIRQLYDIALNSAGLEVECFENSTKLFSRLETKTPDIFLLDIMLDGLDGFEILNFLKSNSKTKNIPVIMVSAKNQELSKVKALDEGCDDYISKPFGIMELVARINANLRKYDFNYFYDSSLDDGLSFSINAKTASNIYQAKKGDADNDEYINAINIGIQGLNSTVKVEIYTDVQDTSDPRSGIKKLEQEQIFEDEGYRLLKLNTPVKTASFWRP